MIAYRQVKELEDLGQERLTEMFGSEKRIKALGRFFQDRKDQGVVIHIISLGYERVILKAMEIVGLSPFEGVKLFERLQIAGHDDLARFGDSKADYIEEMYRTRKPIYDAKSILFVDDDEKNIKEFADKKELNGCLTMLIDEKAGGLSEEDLRVIQETINNGESSKSVNRVVYEP